MLAGRGRYRPGSEKSPRFLRRLFGQTTHALLRLEADRGEHVVVRTVAGRGELGDEFERVSVSGEDSRAVKAPGDVLVLVREQIFDRDRVAVRDVFVPVEVHGWPSQEAACLKQC